MHSILIAGFGGQGVLFAGKVLSYIGLSLGQEVTWFPSYGPEMRGGTANCSVNISPNKIGSPMVTKPNVLIVLNNPSYDKFFNAVAVNGKAFVDKSIVDVEHKRSDIDIFDIDATKICLNEELKGLGNLVLVGKMLKETNLGTVEIAKSAIEKSMTSKKPHLLELNKKAVELGYTTV